jgi:hypothetical protein
MPIDLQNVQARHRRRKTHPSHDCPDREAIDSDIQFLIDKLTAARAEVDRLTENDEDLRASAELWCRLYEAALERAAAAEGALGRSGAGIPAQMQGLYDALERVADLTSALGAVIRECAVCARTPSSPDALSKAANEACVKCTMAIEALARRTR